MNEAPSLDPFIPAFLDEAGLPANQFRVLAHIWRRGKTYSNAATIAAICRLRRHTVFNVLSALEERGLIRRQSRQGQTTLIEPVPFGATGGKGNPSRSEIQEVSRLRLQDPSRLRTHKGNPIKGIPLRKSLKVSKNEIPLVLPFPSRAFAEAWAGWLQYREELKKPVKPTSAKAQLQDMAVWGEEKSIEAMHASIKNGWQGIFEPTQTTGTHQQPPPPEGSAVIGGRTYKPRP